MEIGNNFFEKLWSTDLFFVITFPLVVLQKFASKSQEKGVFILSPTTSKPNLVERFSGKFSSILNNWYAIHIVFSEQHLEEKGTPKNVFFSVNCQGQSQPHTEVSASKVQGFPCGINLQRSPKFRNNMQQPGCLFVISFHSRDFVQVASEEPFNCL